MKKSGRYRQEDGFTLLEMLVVIMIVSVLLVLAISNLKGVNERIESTQNEGIIQTIEAQKIIYKMKAKEEADAKMLYDNQYINEEQLKAYNEAIKAQKENNQGQK